MHYDHDVYEGKISDIQILDNTSYPYTLDPTGLYMFDPDYPSREILGLRDENDEYMVEFDMTMFSAACPRQHDNYDKIVNLRMRGIKLFYMSEYLFRLNDYFFY